MKRHQFFKFTYSRFVNGFLSGRSLKVGTLDEYRGGDTWSIEEYWRNPHSPNSFHTGALESGINDPTEGTSFAKIDHASIGDGRVQEPYVQKTASVVAEHFGIDVRNSRDITIRNMLVRQRIPNAYIFCGSRFKRQSVIDQVKADSTKASSTGEPYDVCIPIVDVPGFGCAISNAIAALQMWQEPPVAQHDDVEYGSIVQDLRATRPLGHIFMKHEAFAAQKEYRIFIPKQIESNRAGMVIDLNCDCKGFFGEPFDV